VSRKTSFKVLMDVMAVSPVASIFLALRPPVPQCAQASIVFRGGSPTAWPGAAGALGGSWSAPFIFFFFCFYYFWGSWRFSEWVSLVRRLNRQPRQCALRLFIEEAHAHGVSC
jgi:hypothetical protein